MSENIELIFQGFNGFGSKVAWFQETEDGPRFCLPLSQIEFDYRALEGDPVDVEMPEWLAKAEGLL